MHAVPVLLMVISCAMAGGCATIRNYPEQMLEAKQQSGKLRNDYENLKRDYNNAVDRYSQAELNTKLTAAEGEKRRKRVKDELKRLRNEIVDVSLLYIDINFLEWERELIRQGALKDVSFSGAAIGLDLATAVAPAVSTARILGAVKGGIDSTRLSVNKDIFFQKTIDTLLITMKGNRAKKLEEIEKDMEKDIEAYPLREAERYLLQYYEAGTIPGALASLNLEAGEKKKEAKEEKKERKTKTKTVLVVVKDLSLDEANKIHGHFDGIGPVFLAKTMKEDKTYIVSARFSKGDLPKKVILKDLPDNEKIKGILEKTGKFKDIFIDQNKSLCATVTPDEGG